MVLGIMEFLITYTLQNSVCMGEASGTYYENIIQVSSVYRAVIDEERYAH